MSVDLPKVVNSDGFYAWTKNNFFRTSYTSHYTQFPEQPKNVAIPGYAGFVPYVKSDNLYGRSYSPITRESFANSKLGVNKFKLSTTGFNHNLQSHLDPSRSANSHKYGMQTQLANHPCVQPGLMQSQYKDNFANPKSLIPPTYRETDRHLQTTKQFTRQSGFSQNHGTFDGTGWEPEKVLDSDMTRTEYRIQYNKINPMHRNVQEYRLRKMQQRTNNYKFT